MSSYLDLVCPVEPVHESIGVGARQTPLHLQEQPRARALKWCELAKVLW
jgi:hypothetical protein